MDLFHLKYHTQNVLIFLINLAGVFIFNDNRDNFTLMLSYLEFCAVLKFLPVIVASLK